MPIYDYVCGSCRHRFEVLHGLNEAGPQTCPVCGGPVSRAFAPPTIVFKGSGWAKKDRRYAGAPTKKATDGATGERERSGDRERPGGEERSGDRERSGDGERSGGREPSGDRGRSGDGERSGGREPSGEGPGSTTPKAAAAEE